MKRIVTSIMIALAAILIISCGRGDNKLNSDIYSQLSIKIGDDFQNIDNEELVKTNYTAEASNETKTKVVSYDHSYNGTFYITGPSEEFFATNHIEILSPTSDEYEFTVNNYLAFRGGGTDEYNGHVVLDGPSGDEAFLVFDGNEAYHDIWFEINDNELYVVIQFNEHPEYSNDKIYFVAESYVVNESDNTENGTVENKRSLPKYEDSFNGKYLSLDNDDTNYSDVELLASDVDNSTFVCKAILTDKSNGATETSVMYVVYDGDYEGTPTYVIQDEDSEEEYPATFAFELNNNVLSILILWGEEEIVTYRKAKNVGAGSKWY
jgi:hypothetical protein